MNKLKVFIFSIVFLISFSSIMAFASVPFDLTGTSTISGGGSVALFNSSTQSTRVIQSMNLSSYCYFDNSLVKHYTNSGSNTASISAGYLVDCGFGFYEIQSTHYGYDLTEEQYYSSSDSLDV